MKIDKINKYIVNKPSKIQIAKDDKWEEVWIIDLTKRLPTSEELREYLQSSSFNYVSIEMLFEQSDGIYIFGMDYNDHLVVKTPFGFLMYVIGITHRFVDFNSFVQELSDKLIGKPYMFIDEADAIRIGVVNHWISVGLCIVWQKDWPKHIQLSELRKKLESNQKLYKTKINYQGMSFAVNLKGFSPGICHWIKSPCCDKKGDSWILSEQKIIQYLKEWADIIVHE